MEEAHFIYGLSYSSRHNNDKAQFNWKVLHKNWPKSTSQLASVNSWSCPTHTQIVYQTALCRDTHVDSGHKHTHRHTHLPRAKQSPCTSHLIPFIVQRKDSSVTNAPVPAEASGNSQSFCCFQASCLRLITPSTYPLLCSLFLSHFLSPLLSSSLLSLCSLSFSSLALWSVFSPCPASAQCTSIIQRQSPGFSGLSNQSGALD